MKFSTNNRYTCFALLTILYFIPLVFFSVYSVLQLPKTKSWVIVSSGFLIISICSLIFFIFLLYWDKTLKAKFKTQVSSGYEQQKKENKVMSLDEALQFEEKQNSTKIEKNTLFLKENAQEIAQLRVNYEDSQLKIAQLNEQLASKENEKQNFLEENRRLENKIHKISQDFSDYKLFGEEQLKQKNLQLTSAQMELEEQRTEMEKRQEQICHLDSKIHDLSYEIRTLIHLHEVDSRPSTHITLQKNEKTIRPFNKFSIPIQTVIPEIYPQEWELDNLSNLRQIQTSPEALMLLRKCVNIAQRLTGANYYSNENSRFREFSSSHFTIDQRRLFDNLRNEESGLILVYSQKENKLLFANNQTKSLLDCSPEKFINEFGSFFQDGLSEWNKALSLLNNSAESQCRLLVKTKQGSEIVLNSYFGLVPTGLFRNYVICVLYPA